MLEGLRLLKKDTEGLEGFEFLFIPTDPEFEVGDAFLVRKRVAKDGFVEGRLEVEKLPDIRLRDGDRDPKELVDVLVLTTFVKHDFFGVDGVDTDITWHAAVVAKAVTLEDAMDRFWKTRAI